MRRPTVPLLCGMLAVAAACGGDRGAPTIPREKFVAANLALRAIPDTAHNRDSLRTAALRRLRVSEKDLRGYLQRHERNTALVASLWAEIADSLHRRDSIAAARAAKPPAPDSATAPGTPGQPQPAAGQPAPSPATQFPAVPGAPELPPGVPMPEIPSRASPQPSPSRPPSTQLEPPHTAAPVRVAPPRPRVKHLPDTAGRSPSP